MEIYQPNSHKAKAERAEAKKKIEKVVNGSVKCQKKSGFQKLISIFIPEDVADVKNYIIMDVLVPAAKKAISDTIDMFLYGETGYTRKKSSSSRVSYGRYYEDKARENKIKSSYETKSGYEFENIILQSRGEAEAVLEQLDELISQYGIISVSDLYETVGITGNYTDNKYGWTSIERAQVVRLRTGEYLLKMPRALPIN